MTSPGPARTTTAGARLTPRRAGLVLAVVLLCLGLPAALDVRPSAAGDTTFAMGVAVLWVGLTVATLVLFVPAWRGRTAPALAIAALQFVAILPALPAFVLPADLVPADGVLLAVVGVATNLIAVILVALDSSAVLLWAAALTSVVAVYAALVAAAGLLLVPSDAERVVQTGAAIAAALLLSPLAAGLRRLTTRLVYGERHSPAQVALRLDRLVTDGDNAVAQAVAQVAATLRLRGLEFREGDRPLAGTGSLDRPATLPLHDGYAFVVGLRPGERRLHRDDRSSLLLAALPLARLAREERLLAELREARAEAAQAREQERLVLHRDLHDGLGPLLTGAALHLDAARNLRGEAAARAVDEARTEVRNAIADVRRVAHGLRPVELENGDLWTTLERRAHRSGVLVQLPEPRPTLSAGTELAAYRIIGEALANAERHAPGALVRLTITGSGAALHIDVRNELAGPEPELGRRDGIGISSMRARAEELGGRADAGPRGTEWRVSVTLPQG